MTKRQDNLAPARAIITLLPACCASWAVLAILYRILHGF